MRRGNLPQWHWRWTEETTESDVKGSHGEPGALVSRL